MSLRGLKLFNKANSAIAEASLAGDNSTTGKYFCEMSKLKTYEETWLEESGELPQDPKYLEKQRVERLARWKASYSLHLSSPILEKIMKRFGFESVRPESLLRFFRVLDSDDDTKLKGIGVSKENGRLRITDDSKFRTTQLRWLAELFLYNPDLHAMVSRLKATIPIISGSFTWLSKHGCKLLLEAHSDAVDASNWIYSAETDVEFWWRLAYAALSNGASASQNPSADVNVSQQPTNMQFPITITPMYELIANGDRYSSIATVERESSLLFDYAYERGQREVYEKVYHDLVAARIAPYRNADSYLMNFSNNGQSHAPQNQVEETAVSGLAVLNQIASQVGCTTFASVSDAIAKFSKPFLRRQPKNVIIQIADILLIDEAKNVTKDEIIKRVLAKLQKLQ